MDEVRNSCGQAGGGAGMGQASSTEVLGNGLWVQKQEEES